MPKIRKEEPNVRALSIGQPWAELILRGLKRIELRSWRTSYRGMVVIHASKKFVTQAARELGVSKQDVESGAFVGVATLKDVRLFTKADAAQLKKNGGGTDWWEPNIYAWVLGDVRRIKPIPFKGRLGLFRLPASVSKKITNVCR